MRTNQDYKNKSGKKYNERQRKKTNRNRKRKRRRRRSRAQEQVHHASNDYLPKEPVFKKSKFVPSAKLPVVV